MFNKNNFCHVASNNRNEQKAGIFVYKTTDDLQTVLSSGYFNEKIIDINLHDLIIHVKRDAVDRTKVERNLLCVVERTLDEVGTILIKSNWEKTTEETIADIQTIINSLDDTYVRIDGTSIMTGPLLMRATESFKCAIAPYWDGVGFFKLNDNNSVTLMASLEYQDGFTPAETNTYNIGTSTKKWKNLYLAGKAYVSVINNGYDIAVPVTAQPETLALKSEVDLAANSGRMITDQGVWYAKMYAASTVPTGAEYDGKNYADFSQVDSDNNPIIVIYEGQSGAWVQTETITPPAEYDGYVPITSKIWDIVEQTGQQGGRVLWNHQSKDFTPYPQIISLENAALTGVPTAPLPTDASPNDQIATKEYVDSHSSTGGYHPGLLSWEWDDHVRDDVQWLRADTFSWQDGGVYEAAYKELYDDVYVSTYWRYNGTNVSTAKAVPDVGDAVYSDPDLTTQVGTVEAYDSANNTITYNGNTYSYYSAYFGTTTAETVAGITINVYSTHSGRKIVNYTEESNVSAIYAATGVAWYYIISAYNKKFKLPRAKHNKYTSELGVAGNGMTLGVTDGTNNAGVFTAADNPQPLTSATNDYGKNVGTTVTGGRLTTNKIVGITTDASKSGMVAQQEEDTDQYKYLYFYVGEFTQTALENTAGITAETLNDKIDTDLGNISTSAKNTIIGYMMPDYASGQNITINTDYPCPSHGWVFVTTSGTGGSGTLTINSATFTYFESSGANSRDGLFMPVSKNDVVKYNKGSGKFYPCKG